MENWEWPNLDQNMDSWAHFQHLNLSTQFGPPPIYLLNLPLALSMCRLPQPHPPYHMSLSLPTDKRCWISIYITSCQIPEASYNTKQIGRGTLWGSEPPLNMFPHVWQPFIGRTRRILLYLGCRVGWGRLVSRKQPSKTTMEGNTSYRAPTELAKVLLGLHPHSRSSSAWSCFLHFCS